MQTTKQQQGRRPSQTRPDYRTTRAPGMATAGDRKGEENEMARTMATTTAPPTAAVSSWLHNGNGDRDHEDEDKDAEQDEDANDDTRTRMVGPHPPFPRI